MARKSYRKNNRKQKRARRSFYAGAGGAAGFARKTGLINKIQLSPG